MVVFRRMARAIPKDRGIGVVQFCLGGEGVARLSES